MLARLVFPIPEIRNFNRVAFTQLGPALEADDSGEERANSRQTPLRNVAITWVSEPDGVAFEHNLNLYGFRGGDFALKKRAGATRVAFIGDSFVEGMGVGDDETLPRQFDRLGRDVEVLNLGVGAADIPEYLHLSRIAIPLLRPDVVFLVLYANDLPVHRSGAAAPRSTFLPVYRRQWMPRLVRITLDLMAGAPPATFYHRGSYPFFRPVPHPSNPWSAKERVEGLSQQIYEAMTAGRFNPFLVNPAPAWEWRLSASLNTTTSGETELEEIRALAREVDSVFIAAYIPVHVAVSDRYRSSWNELGTPFAEASLTTRRFRGHQEYLAGVFDRLDVPFVDTTPAIAQAEALGEQLYLRYDSHMNANGYRLVARELRLEFERQLHQDTERNGAD